MVLFHEEGEEAYCSCRRRIPRDWLKKTVDEIIGRGAQFGTLLLINAHCVCQFGAKCSTKKGNQNYTFNTEIGREK